MNWIARTAFLGGFAAALIVVAGPDWAWLPVGMGSVLFMGFVESYENSNRDRYAHRKMRANWERIRNARNHPLN